MFKKKFVSVLTCSLLCLSLAACGGSSSTAESDADETEETEFETVEYELDEYDPADYIVSSSYLGVEVEREEREVTDEEYEEYLQSFLESYADYEQITDRETEDGDTVNVDYVGTLDGEEFDGGSASDVNIILGYGVYVDGFEEGMMNRPVGEEFSYEVTFPEDYGVDEIDGQTVTFTVTINYIEGDLITPELTDDFVLSIYDSWECTTVEEFEEAFAEELAEEKANYAEYLEMLAVWDAIMANTEFGGFPENYYEAYSQDMIVYYMDYASYFDYELEDFMSEYYGIDMDEFYSEVDQSVTSELQSEILYQYIAETEDIDVTDDEYEDVLEYYASYYGYDDPDDFIADYGEDAVYVLCYENALYSKVVQYCYDNAVFVDPVVEEDDTEDEVEEEVVDDDAAEEAEDAEGTAEEDAEEAAETEE